MVSETISEDLQGQKYGHNKYYVYFQDVIVYFSHSLKNVDY